MSATSNERSASEATVRLTPSIVIEPLSTRYRASSGFSETFSRYPPVSSKPAAVTVPDPVHVALDDVTVETPVQSHGPLEVDRGAGLEAGQTGTVEGLGHDVHREARFAAVDNRETHAVDGNRVTDTRIANDVGCPNIEADVLVAYLDGTNRSQLFDDPGEHVSPSSVRRYDAQARCYARL